MFGGSKLFASSFLFSNTLFVLNNKNKQKIAECEPSKAAEKSAQDLDAIFAAANEGGMAPDPEEIQEMIMKAQGRTIRYVYCNLNSE